MNNRLLLAFFIVLLWIFIVFANHFYPLLPSTIFIVLFMTLYCCILSLVRLYHALFKTKSVSALDNAYQPFVNIFIPAHNEEFVLVDTIENILKIDYPNFNILIVDDRSQDKTSDVAKELSDKYPDKVKFFTRSYDSFPGKSAVLNDAFEMTSGELICVFDADAKVSPDFLSCTVNYFSDEKVAGLQVRKYVSNRNYNLLTLVQHCEYCMDAFIQKGRDELNGSAELRGNGELLRRSAVKEIGGWNNNTLTDDLDMSTKLHISGYKIRFCQDVVVMEEGVKTVKSIINQRKRWAEGGIRRYLDYFSDILKAKNTSFLTILDIIAYFSEFVLPIWLISDIFVQLVSFVYTGQINILLNISIMLFIQLLFMFMLIISLNKYEQFGLFKLLIYSFATSAYLMLLWTIVVAVVVIKIIFKPRDMKWSKTDHFGV